jgi:pimeloyl-ACP methyl ester carboxylesterase
LTIHRALKLVCLFILSASLSNTVMADIWTEAEHGYADNNGVRIHYASVGKGPLLVMIHGFPDFWYSWRHQMAGLQDHFQVVAIDQRGYNLSDQPKGDENYQMNLLVSDVAAVIHHLGQDKATVVGHDWGGMVAWAFAFRHPELLDKLIILNLPHPNGLAREWASNDQARANTSYAQTFKEGSPSDPKVLFGGPMTAQRLAGWVRDEEGRKHYVEAFEQSDFDAMLAYYKVNYPDLPEPGSPPQPPAPPINVPVLMFHGLDDSALPAGALNDTWQWINSDLTLVTVPGADHFVQQDAAELVTSTMKWWLLNR